ncbi:MAG: hypothetical protein AAF950_08950 [Pseudomonadota bacterium]
MAERIIRNLALIILAIGTFLSPMALAHTPHDDVFAVTVSPDFTEDQTVYTLTRSSVLKSTDSGKSWKRMIRGLDNIQMLVDLVLGPDGETLYTASRGEGVFRSLDGGETWINASLGLTERHIHKLAISPLDSSQVLAVAARGDLFITENSGESWQALEGPFGDVTAAAIGSAEDGSVLIYVGTVEGKIFSSGGFDTWEQVFESDENSSISAIAVQDGSLSFGNNNGHLFFRSATANLVEKQVFSTVPAPITSITFSPDFSASGRIYASHWKDGIYCGRGTDVTWELCDRGLTIDQQAISLGRPNFSEVAVSPDFADDATLFVAGYDGLFRSDTAGTSFSELETFPINYIVSTTFSPNYSTDKQMLMTTMLWGLFESNNGGDTWRDINSNELIDYPRHNGLTRLFQPVYSPNYEKDDTIFLSTWYAPLKSTNGGRTWQKLEAPQTDSFKEKRHQALVMAASPEYATDQTVFASTNWGEIVRSEDGGQTFETVTKLTGNSGSFAFSPAYGTDGLMFAGDISGVWRSADRGQTWSHTPLVPAEKLEPYVLPVGYPRSEIVGFLSFLDVERGKSQTQRITLSPGFEQDGIVFVAGSEGLHRSGDRGLSWTPVDLGSFSERSYVETVAISPDFSNDGTVVISVRGNGMLKSTNGGINFAPLATHMLDQQIQFSQFDGVTPKFPAILFSPDYATDQMMFGYEGDRFYRSADAGETWTEVAAPVPAASTKRLRYYVRYIYPIRFWVAGFVLLGGVVFLSLLVYLFRERLGLASPMDSKG